MSIWYTSVFPYSFMVSETDFLGILHNHSLSPNAVLELKLPALVVWAFHYAHRNIETPERH